MKISEKEEFIFGVTWKRDGANWRCKIPSRLGTVEGMYSPYSGDVYVCDVDEGPVDDNANICGTASALRGATACILFHTPVEMADTFFEATRHINCSTFDSYTLEDFATRIRTELDRCMDNPENAENWADVVFSAISAMHKLGVRGAEIIGWIKEKQLASENRQEPQEE